MACLSKKDIISEISDLHLLKIEYFVLALLRFDLIPLFCQAAEHLTPTSLMCLAHVGTEALSVIMASLPEFEVEAVVLTGSSLILFNLVLALVRHVCLRSVILQAPACRQQVYVKQAYYKPANLSLT